MGSTTADPSPNNLGYSFENTFLPAGSATGEERVLPTQVSPAPAAKSMTESLVGRAGLEPAAL